ncbi:MAG: VOC family protein [Acidimicrobiia bacterium]
MLRRNINCIDHIAICVRPENLESAVRQFSELLDITFEGPFPNEKAGITYYLDWESGMEVYAPTNPAVAVERVQFLEEHGDGMFRLVFGVSDLDKAVDRARSMDQDVRQVSAFNMNPLWRERFDKMDEALLGTPVHGVRLAFSQIEPTQPSPE